LNARARPAPPKDRAALEHEWDSVAELRRRQIESGEDLSYHHVLVPAILRLARHDPGTRVLDAGCGVGFLTALIARSAREVVGVDMSPASIALARRLHGAIPNARFLLEAIEDLRLAEPVALAVSNMTLMSVVDLPGALASLHENLEPGGSLVFTTTHPWFWPRYCGYDDEPWFAYDREMPIEWRYHTSAGPEDGPVVTHIHRSLERYWSVLDGAGFDPEEIAEPLPPPGIAARYPKPWRFPRFLAVRCRRT
jgi:SAM-dependent methyltransferase